MRSALMDAKLADVNPMNENVEPFSITLSLPHLGGQRTVGREGLGK